MDTAIYIRVSTDKQSTDMQLAELHEYAIKNKYQIYRIYRDHGFSGRNTNRPALNELLRDARDLKFRRVIVWKFDRFARSLIELVSMLKELTGLGIEFMSLKDNIDFKTSQGRLMLHMISAFAEFESDMIRERVKSSLDHAKKYGTKSGRKIGAERKHDYGPILRLRKEGKTLYRIAQELNIPESTVRRAVKLYGPT